MGNKCGAHTIPYIKNNSTSTIEHEATTTKINKINFITAIKED